jgi:pyruvate kinase
MIKKTKQIKQTKIVCTIGPACESVEILEKMVHAGMNVARLNFSHGTYENHAMLIKHIREVEKRTGEPVAILQDLQGPKIRLGVLPEGGVTVVTGTTIVLTAEPRDEGDIPIGYEELCLYVKPGERILLDDGKCEVKVLEVDGKRIRATVVVGGVLTSHKGINVPESTLSGLEVFTAKDKEDLRFGIEQGVDLVALSFVMDPQDILDVRFYIKEVERELNMVGGDPIRIVAKIEKHEAVQKLEKVIEVADAVMVARGDLGIEIPAEQVPLIQKKIIDVARAHAKPVIVATQMLDSMQKNPRPTRAEVSDVSNAVIDHTDAVMLSNETATGDYPVETVETMRSIILSTEHSSYDDVESRGVKPFTSGIDDTISSLSKVIAEDVDAELILAASLSGDTGRLISRYRPELPITVATSSDRVVRQLNISWGVKPFLLKECKTIEELVDRSILELQNRKLVEKGDRIIVVAGEPVGHAGHVNLLEVREV